MKMTDAEKLVWTSLRNGNLEGFKFRRQVPFGSFILDFYCAEKKIVIEADGGQHYSKQGKEADKIRDDYLASYGLKVLRYSDKDILTNIRTVLEEIFRLTEERNPHPAPLLVKERE